MIITTDKLIGMVQRHKSHLSLKIMKPLFETMIGDCTNVQDCVLMYLIILDSNPDKIIEFSPMLGYSTRYLATAMRTLGKPASMFTVESKRTYINKAQKRINELDLSKYCQIIEGDAIKITTRELIKRKWNVGFAFIDSNHSYDFGKEYIEKVFPLLTPGCVVMIHDICGESANTGPHDIEFKTSLRSNKDKFAEYRAVKEFLVDNNIAHTLTHPLFGGWWQSCKWRSVRQESSPKLPENEKFYKAYEEIVGYDLNKYRNFQHPNGLLFKI